MDPKLLESTLNDILTAVRGLQVSTRSVVVSQESLQESVDELITKVDEINLPTGDGFERGYES